MYYLTLPHIALYWIKLHCIELHCITLQTTLHCIAFHCTSPHYLTLPYLALLFLTLPSTALHCVPVYPSLRPAIHPSIQTNIYPYGWYMLVLYVFFRLGMSARPYHNWVMAGEPKALLSSNSNVECIALERSRYPSQKEVKRRDGFPSRCICSVVLPSCILLSFSKQKRIGKCGYGLRLFGLGR